MNYFLSGGAKNGKSSLAQQIVCAQGGPHYYLATMIPHDDEDRLRIRRHLENRAGLGFQTVECGTDILASLSQMDPDGAVLLDSVTALLSNEMFRADGTMDVLAPARLEAELLEFSRRMRCCVPPRARRSTLAHTIRHSLLHSCSDVLRRTDSSRTPSWP